MEKSRKKSVSGLVFGIGLIALLIGALTNLYTAKIGALIMLGVWIIGGALVGLVMGCKKEPGEKKEPATPPEPPKQP